MGCGQTYYSKPLVWHDVDVYLQPLTPTTLSPSPNPVPPPLGWMTRAARSRKREVRRG